MITFADLRATVGAALLTVVVVLATTGIALATMYRPSPWAEEVVPGQVARIATAGDMPVVDPLFGDTVLLPGETGLVAAVSAADRVPSQAAASVLVDIDHRMPGGAALRAIHHHGTSVAVVLAVAFVSLCLAGMAVPDRRWTLGVLLMVVLMVAAWTGRLLPDDIYASVSYAIVGSALREAPLGWLIGPVLSVGAEARDVLPRTYAVHAMVMGPAALALAWLVRDRSVGRWQLVGIGGGLLAVLACGAVGLASGAEALPRSVWAAGGGNAYHVEPWWMFRWLTAWNDWFGAELAGSVVLLWFGSLLTMPWWYGRLGRRSVILVLTLPLTLAVIGILTAGG